ncbi:hypothetical protein F2Q69_00047196 [Brassica cretica]|uniref:DUF4005 domain-containing protein n=1 Tax=Brassica cretica TaxID=69181 RepID=A0A8S9PJ24_BRACR|nr:hypothetical protein F2Q69_00047196 [Brassica cretica]
MIGFEVQGVLAVGLYFTFAILQPPVRAREDSGASGLPYVLAYRGCVSPGFLRWRSSGKVYNGNSSAIPLGDLSGNVARSPASVVYDEYQKVKARKRRLSYTPPPGLARAALSARSLSSISSPRLCLTGTFWQILIGD